MDIGNIRPIEYLLGGKKVEVVQSYGDVFLKEAIYYKDKKVEFATRVYYMSHWPTYATMNTEQKKWYFYWRNQIRNNIFLDTDESYIYIYLYEIIAGIGWHTVEEGYYCLKKIWNNYCHYDSINETLANWIFDFIYINEIPIITLKKIEYLIFSSNSKILFNKYIEKLKDDKTSFLSFNSIEKFSKYKISKGKVYEQEANRELIRNTIEEIFNKINKYMMKKYDKGFFDFYKPDCILTNRRYLFANAIKKKIQYHDINYIPYDIHEPLISKITNIFKLTENKFRKKFSIRGRLKECDIEVEFFEIINIAFKRLDNIVIKKNIKLNISKEKIEKYRIDSEEISKLLTISDEEKYSHYEEENVAYELIKTENTTIPTGNMKEHTSDDNWYFFIKSLCKENKDIIKIIFKNYDVNDKLKEVANKYHIMIESAIDDINETFYSLFNDLLIDAVNLTILDEYKEELMGVFEKYE